MKLSILIPNWNGKRHLEKCLLSIFSHPPSLDYEVIVYDNGSTDGSCEMVKKKFRKVKLIEGEKNKGFAFAVNRMIERAKGEYLGIVNSDIFYNRDPFTPIISFMEEKKEVGVVGPKLLKPEGGIHTTMGRHFPNIYSAFVEITGIAPRLASFFPFYRLSSFIEPPLSHLKEKYTGHVEASFMVVRRKVFEEFGGFDENFFAYYEDLDFQLRIRKKWKVYYMAGVEVYHVGGGSFPSRTKEASRLYIRSFLYYFYKNRPYWEYRVLPFIYLLKGKKEVKECLRERFWIRQEKDLKNG
ncbi:hypothetical protein DRQ16_03730 [bacterium]|nr:MAG: hypothetical protein DRQ16_03730 [bacterium]